MAKPRALAPGDRLRLVAPGSAPEPEKLARGVRILREMGFDVELARGVREARRNGYLSAPDVDRARDFVEAFADPDVDGVMCTNGGFGSARILRHVDWSAVLDHPKVFVGFSDATALHLAIRKEAGWVTFGGPMAAAGPDYGLAKTWTRDRLLAAVSRAEPLGALGEAPEGELLRTVRPGRASGPLVGGNLSLVAASLGTPWEIDTRGCVLFLEEWKEPPYKIDAMLTQLRLAGKLEEAAAVVFGEFPHCAPLEAGPTLWVEEVIQDATADLARPAVLGLAAGHGHEQHTIPFGARATVDADARLVRVDEAGVAPR